jgi:hypothetical protein
MHRKKERKTRKEKNKYHLVITTKAKNKISKRKEKLDQEKLEREYDQTEEKLRLALLEWERKGCVEEPDSTGYQQKGYWKEKHFDPLFIYYKDVAERLHKTPKKYDHQLENIESSKRNVCATLHESVNSSDSFDNVKWWFE